MEYNLNINPSILKSQYEFLSSQSKMAVFLGGVGCVHPETKIDVRINEMSQKIEISDPILRERKFNKYRSFNGLDFDYRIGSQPFKKGVGDLYRVITQEGEIIVHESHEFLCSDNHYRQLKSFEDSDFCALMPTSREKAAFRLIEDIYLLFDRIFKFIKYFIIQNNFIRSISYSIAGYSFDPTLDQIIKFLENLIQLIQDDVNIFSVRITKAESVSHPLTEKELIHLYNSFAYDLSKLAFDQLPQFKRTKNNAKDIKKTLDRLRKIWEKHDFRYHPTERSRNKVLSIEKHSHGEYWDLQVAGTNNYVAHDMVHHNSGKTYSAGDFLLKMAQEYPKTLGLVTCNTYQQLINSTVKAITDRWDEIGLVRDIDYKVKLGITKQLNVLGRTSLLYSLNNEVPAKGLTVGYWLCDESAFVKKKNLLTHVEHD